MATGDITPYNDGAFGQTGSVVHQVASGGTPPAINAGEPVDKTLGNQYVITLATSGPVVATNHVVGIAATASTETSSADGTVAIVPFLPGQIWLISPKTASTWNTQTLYNALVGFRVTLDKTAGVYTINASDGATNGCVVENLNIAQYPGKVAFSVRSGATYLGDPA